MLKWTPNCRALAGALSWLALLSLAILLPPPSTAAAENVAAGSPYDSKIVRVAEMTIKH
jgi:hypothetical protein